MGGLKWITFILSFVKIYLLVQELRHRHYTALINLHFFPRHSHDAEHHDLQSMKTEPSPFLTKKRGREEQGPKPT
jgi:hypothetical protein